MSRAMDDAAFVAAVQAHKAGAPAFTRRMVIALARMDEARPKETVLRCERLGLLKPGAWQWFADNGGITADQVRQVRAELG